VVRTIYTFFLWLLLPFILLRLALRSRRQPGYMQHVGERFGFYSILSEKPVIWLHAVSVGETRAAASLISKLGESHPECSILLTHTTPTGREAGEQLYGDKVMRTYLPYDYPFAVKRFLRRFKPKIGILMETEIWFNLIHHAKMPILLMNARMSEKSARGYARTGNLAQGALKKLSMVAAQTQGDAERLLRIGAKNVSVMGNLKYDFEPPEPMLRLGLKLREQFGRERRVFLAASTREGEEALILDEWSNPSILLVIVPRHPQRFEEVARILEKRGLRFQRRSQDLNVPAEIEVMLGDTMGEMFAYYAASDLAFIGGSLLPYGGQNLIEACAVGKPVLIGPYTYNFADATKLAVEAGAAIQVMDTQEMVQKAGELLSDAEALQKIGGRGRKFVAAHRGATESALKIIDRILSKGA
jgi:3-deoxy-D-manno-octulosonic-acid transferase